MACMKVLSLYILLQSTSNATRWLGVQDSEFGVGTELHHEVRQKDLDIGFCLCTVPTCCHGPGISDIGLGSGIEVEVWG